MNVDSQFDLPAAQPRQLADLAGIGRTLADGAVALLVLAGVAGTVFNLAARDGWIVQLFGRSLAGGLAALLALLIIGLGVVMALEALTARQRARLSELLCHGFAIMGAIYLAQLALKGGAFL